MKLSLKALIFLIFVLNIGVFNITAMKNKALNPSARAILVLNLKDHIISAILDENKIKIVTKSKDEPLLNFFIYNRYNILDPHYRAQIPLSGAITSLCFNNDKNHIAFLEHLNDNLSQVNTWAIFSDRSVNYGRFQGRATSIAWGEGDVTLLTGFNNTTTPFGTLLSWSMPGLAPLEYKTYENNSILALAWNKIAAVTLSGNVLEIIGAIPQDFQTKSLLGSLKFNNDGTMLAAGTLDPKSINQEVHLLIYNDKEEQWVFFKKFSVYAPIRALAFSPDNKLIAAACGNKVFVWDIQSEELVDLYSGHSKLVTSIEFSDDSCEILSGSEDCTIQLWKLQNNGSEGESDIECPDCPCCLFM